jgi:hypothetical protein
LEAFGGAWTISVAILSVLPWPLVTLVSAASNLELAVNHVGFTVSVNDNALAGAAGKAERQLGACC